MGQPSGNRINGGLKNSADTMRFVRFEMDTKFIDEKNRLDRVGECGEDFVYSDEEKGATQQRALRDPIGLVVGRMRRLYSKRGWKV